MQGRMLENIVEIILRESDCFSVDMEKDIITVIVQQRKQSLQLFPIVMCHDEKCVSHTYVIPSSNVTDCSLTDRRHVCPILSGIRIGQKSVVGADGILCVGLSAVVDVAC